MKYFNSAPYLKIFLFCLGLTIAITLPAQTTISGQITNEHDQPIADANVLFKSGIDLLSFAITEADGKFTMELKTLPDSTIIEVRHLSYGLTVIPVEAGKMLYNIQVFPQDYILPEVAIEKAPPITRRGDTLFFDVESYVQEGDENIEQVLKRLPGVQVSVEGRITYDGLDISKFYIEGLDLLEGQYRIATRNLGPQHIQEIQILERHQPIKALDSISKPDNAAVNLKLKSDIAITGNFRAEAGLPAVGLLAGRIFGFTKKQQFQVSGAYNNLGEKLSADYVNFYQQAFDVNQDLIALDRVRDPFVFDSPRLYWDNNEWNAGFNYLRKLSENLQIKAQGYGNLDKIIRSGTNTSNFFVGETVSTFDKNYLSTSLPAELTGRAIFELNAPKFFTKFRTELKLEREQADADNVINAVNTLEQFEQNSLEVNSELNMLLNHKNKKAFQFKTEFQYLEKDYQLDLQDAVIFAPALGNQSNFSELRQIATTENLIARFYTNFYVKKKNLEGLIELGPKISRKAIQSSTLDQFESSEANLINETFQNDATTTRTALALDQSWTYEKGRWQIDLDIPFSFNRFRIADTRTADRPAQDLFIYRPKLSVDYEVSIIKIGAGISYFQDFLTYGDLFYEGLLVQSNRNVNTQINEPNRYQGFRANTGLSGLNPMNNHYFSLGLSYTAQTNEQLQANSFNELGTAVDFQRLENQSQQFSVNGLYKFYLWRTVEFELKANYTLREQDQLVNEVFSPIISHRLGTEQNISFAYGSQATTLSLDYSRFWLPELDQNNDQVQLELDHFWKINQSFGAKMEFANIYFAGGGEGVWTQLLNLSLQYDLKKQKSKLSLTAYNLLNEDFFTRFSQGLYSNFTSTYRLNPRRLILAFRRQF